MPERYRNIRQKIVASGSPLVHHSMGERWLKLIHDANQKLTRRTKADRAEVRKMRRLGRVVEAVDDSTLPEEERDRAYDELLRDAGRSSRLVRRIPGDNGLVHEVSLMHVLSDED